MKRPLLSLLFSAAVLASPVSACMNDYVPNVAAIERSKSVLDQLQKHVEKEPWDVRRDRLRRELAAGGDYKVKNDLATALAHTGEAAEAVTLLEQIEAEKPGLYVTAANLGTAYELSGNDERALEWIRKGIERNAKAHEGTEWLHIRILEAKLALKSDPEWLDGHSITDPTKDAATSEFSATGNRGEPLSAQQVKDALTYQLHERLQFVQPPDAIVGALLVDLSNLIAKESTGPGTAYDVIKLAEAYLKDSQGVDILQNHVHDMVSKFHRGLRKPRTELTIQEYAGTALVGVLIGLPIIAVKRMIQRRLAGKGTQAAA